MALAVDCDPGQSSPFKADWDSVGQCEMDWDNGIFMALASLGRLGQRGILGQSSILDNLQGRLGQCGLGHGYPLIFMALDGIPIGYSWHWHPWVDWDSVESWDKSMDGTPDLHIHGKSMDTHWISMAAVDWDSMALASLGRLGLGIFDLRQPSRQTGTVWTGAGLGQ